MTRYGIAMAALCVAAAAGCGSTPKAHFYTLSAVPAAAGATAPSATAGYGVAVGPITVPEAVDRPQIVVRLSPSQVEISELHRWAAPLKSEIPRVIAEHLTRLLDTARVWAYPGAAGLESDYRVLLEVERFDSTLGDGVAVDALWTVRRVSGGAPRSGRSSVRERAAGEGYDGLVAAHDRALAAVSRDIAQAIRELRAAP